MTKKSNLKVWSLWIVIGLVGILAIGGLALAYQGAVSRVIENVENYYEASTANPISVEEELGGTSPIIPFNYLSVGGVVQDFYHLSNMAQATTTLCSIKNPLNATTTLEFFSFQITTGTSTAASIVLATSTLRYATSTTNVNLITSTAVAANAQISVSYRPPVGIGVMSGSGYANIIKPNEYLLLRTEGAGLSGYTYTGTCNAILRRF